MWGEREGRRGRGEEEEGEKEEKEETGRREESFQRLLASWVRKVGQK